MVPSSAAMPRAACGIAVRSVTSRVTARARTPRRRAWSAAPSKTADRRPTSATFTPAPANAMAMACPIPRPPPVMRATRVDRCRGDRSPLLSADPHPASFGLPWLETLRRSAWRSMVTKGRPTIHGLCMQKRKNIGRAFGSCPGDPDSAGARQRTSGARVARGNGSAVAPLHPAAARATTTKAVRPRRLVIAFGGSWPPMVARNRRYNARP